MQCLMDHIVLNVEDEEEIIVFYSKVLELETERMEEYKEGRVPFPSVRLNSNTIIDLFPKKMWQTNTNAGQGREHLNHFKSFFLVFWYIQNILITSKSWTIQIFDKVGGSTCIKNRMFFHIKKFIFDFFPVKRYINLDPI